MYLFVQDFFTHENIVVPLMDYYKDFSYVDYVMNLEFEYGYRLYKKCIEAINLKNETELRNKYWDLFLIEIQNGYEGSFEEYYGSKVKSSKIDAMSDSDKDAEEQRIINKFSGAKVQQDKPKPLIIERVVV